MKQKELMGQHLSLPTGHADWQEKLKWFGWDEFMAAAAVGFKPAIEWKGKPPTEEIVRDLRERGIYWGIHAPNNFADQAYADWETAMAWTGDVAQLQPGYVVVHGGLDLLIRDVPFDDPITRYHSPVSAEDYLSTWDHQHQTLMEMVGIMGRFGTGRVLCENTSVTEFVGGTKLPTYVHPRFGNWIKLPILASYAGAGCLCDVGHLTYGHNFYARLENYADLPLASEFVPASETETVVWREMGLGIRKGEFPVTRDLLELPKAIEAIGANHFHLDPGYREDLGGRIGSHGPIELDDQRIRGIIAQIISRENCLMCLEVDGSRADGSGPFPDRAPTEELQASSWRNLCRIVTELVS